MIGSGEEMPTFVSIIMPVYNGEAYLQAAIESVLAQSYPHWELVVVDDGSTDGTARIVRSFEDERIRYSRQENRGQAAALNRGLELARGDAITTLDADDCLTVDSIRARAEFLDANPAYGVVYADGVYCNADGVELLTFKEHMPAGVQGDVYDTLIVSPFYGTGASVLVRRDVLARHDIRYDEDIVWCQDWDFYIRLAEKTTFGFVDMVSIRYRLHEGGMTAAMPKGRRLDSLIRLRYKVLASERFGSTVIRQKDAYFYDFLVKDLHQLPEAQAAVFASAAFQSCPGALQGRLMRLVANVYLLEYQHLEMVGVWLRHAWFLSPGDIKTALAFFLFQVHPSLARRIVQAYMKRVNPAGATDPFQLAAVTTGNARK
jgi:glycosyltransferase involved in cell wall biosynthesis